MVKLIKDKGYIVLDKKRLTPAPRGVALCGFVVEHFPQVFEYEYTARLESELDLIASGGATRLGVLTAFWEAFEPA